MVGNDSPRVTARNPRVARLAALLVLSTLFVGGWAGCSSESGTRASSVPPSPTKQVVNDMAQNSAHRVIPVAGENFDIRVDYFCTTYDASRWHTLEAKTVNYSYHLVPKAGLEDQIPRVLVTQFQASVALVASDSRLDGFVVTSSADAATGLPGYVLSNVYPYDGALAVPGYTPALESILRSVTKSSDPLTESGIKRAGIAGTRITFSLGLVVTNYGETDGHKRTVTDVVTISEA